MIIPLQSGDNERPSMETLSERPPSTIWTCRSSHIRHKIYPWISFSNCNKHLDFATVQPKDIHLMGKKIVKANLDMLEK
eukprot:c24244_g1_i1 orf=3-236(-)